jgi:hypothetical protein
VIPNWVFPHHKVLLDANLLVVLIIGLVRESLFTQRYVTDYSLADFRLIARVVQNCHEIVVTPYILAEASGILNKTGYARDECRGGLAELLIPIMTEHYTPSKLLPINSIRQFGIADASILEASTNNVFVLTADGPLYSLLRSHGRDAILYDDIRYLAQDN